MQDILIKFKEYLQLSHKSAKTIYDRVWYIKHFFTFLQTLGLKDPLEINTNHLKEYRRYINEYINKRGHKDKPRTINSRIQAVRLFLSFLYKEDYIAQDLTDEIPYIKEPKTLPSTVLTNQEIKKLLRQCNTNTAIGYRNRAILEVLYSSGLRRNELINLRIEDIDTENGYIKVNRGKGDKDRVVPLGKIASQYVQNYVTGVRKLQLDPIRSSVPMDIGMRPTSNGVDTGEDPGWLFLSKSGNKLCEDAVRDLIITATRQAGIEKHVTTHTFRRSCATEMIKNNANIMHVKEILGHEDISSTQEYAKLTIIDLKEAHRKYHPREKDNK